MLAAVASASSPNRVVASSGGTDIRGVGFRLGLGWVVLGVVFDVVSIHLSIDLGVCSASIQGLHDGIVVHEAAVSRARDHGVDRYRDPWKSSEVLLGPRNASNTWLRASVLTLG